MIPEFRWLYRARYHSIVDGDTIRFEFDLGMFTRAVHPVRLAGINAPEIYRGTDEEKEAGQAARQYVIDWLQAVPGWNDHLQAPEGIHREGWVYLIETDRDRRSFNRYIGTVWRINDGACLNDDLIRDGHAVAWP